MSISTGQRKYGGPPPAEVYEGDPPGNGCQVSNLKIFLQQQWFGIA